MPRDQSQRSEDEWSNGANKKSMEICRTICGLEPITIKKSACYKCYQLFEAQFVGSKMNEHYCRRCRDQMGRARSMEND